MAAQGCGRLCRWYKIRLDREFHLARSCDSPVRHFLWRFCGAITDFLFEHGGEGGGNQESALPLPQHYSRGLPSTCWEHCESHTAMVQCGLFSMVFLIYTQPPHAQCDWVHSNNHGLGYRDVVVGNAVGVGT